MPPGPEGFDPSRILMSERQRQRHAERIRCIDDVEIRMTDARGTNADEHLARSGLRLRYGAEFGRVWRGQLEGSHDTPRQRVDFSGTRNASVRFSFSNSAWSARSNDT